jgi:hypothetical protein
VVVLPKEGLQLQRILRRDTSSIHRTRRGLEKTLFQFTIVAGIVFARDRVISSIVID